MADTPLMIPSGLETITRLNARLREVTEADKAFQIIADELKTTSKSDYAMVFLVERGSSTVMLVGMAGVPAAGVVAVPGIEVDQNTRQLLLEKASSRAIRFDSQAEIPSVGQLAAKSLDVGCALVSPIMLHGELIGYLSVANRTGSPPFPPEADAAFPMISDYFAIVVDNVRSTMQLRRAKSETERLLSLAPILIFTCDSRGIFSSVNKQMLRILDKDREEDLVGTSVFEQPILLASGLETLISQGMEGHDGERANVHVVQSSDKAYYLHARVTPIMSEKEEVERVLFVAMDVTSKVRLQNQLERSYEKMTQTYQELERVTKMKTQFIDIVSHELRTPLTVMRGYIDLLESEYSARLEPRFASRLAIVKANTDKLYSLVESMLDVSRLEKGAIEIHPEPLKIDAVLEDIVKMRAKDAEEKKQGLALDIEGKLPLIMADRRRLKDVFNNIIDNAIKYTQEGGKIHVGVRDEGKMVHVWVRDNGIGIPLESLGQIFDRFHIVSSNDLSHQVNRLGLGLPISKGIVEAHGGKIWVESQVGKGSVFHVDIPKEPPK